MVINHVLNIVLSNQENFGMQMFLCSVMPQIKELQHALLTFRSGVHVPLMPWVWEMTYVFVSHFLSPNLSQDGLVCNIA